MRFIFAYTKETEESVAQLTAGVEKMGRAPTKEEMLPVANAIRTQYQRSFDGEGSIGGARWFPLAPSTVRQRIRLGFGGTNPILVRTGGYRNSWIDPNNPNHVEELYVGDNGWQLLVGSKDYRTAWHEHGTPHMPARPVRPGFQREAIAINAAVKDVYDKTWRSIAAVKGWASRTSSAQSGT